jgi:hypothetical protein
MGIAKVNPCHPLQPQGPFINDTQLTPSLATRTPKFDDAKPYPVMEDAVNVMDIVPATPATG